MSECLDWFTATYSPGTGELTQTKNYVQLGQTSICNSMPISTGTCQIGPTPPSKDDDSGKLAQWLHSQARGLFLVMKWAVVFTPSKICKPPMENIWFQNFVSPSEYVLFIKFHIFPVLNIAMVTQQSPQGRAEISGFGFTNPGNPSLTPTIWALSGGFGLSKHKGKLSYWSMSECHFMKVKVRNIDVWLESATCKDRCLVGKHVLLRKQQSEIKYVIDCLNLSLQKKLDQLHAVDMQHFPAKLPFKLHLFAYVEFLAQSLCSLHSDCASKLAWLNHFWRKVGVITEASCEFLHVNCRQIFSVEFRLENLSCDVTTTSSQSLLTPCCYSRILTLEPVRFGVNLDSKLMQQLSLSLISSDSAYSNLHSQEKLKPTRHLQENPIIVKKKTHHHFLVFTLIINNSLCSMLFSLILFFSFLNKFFSPIVSMLIEVFEVYSNLTRQAEKGCKIWKINDDRMKKLSERDVKSMTKRIFEFLQIWPVQLVTVVSIMGTEAIINFYEGMLKFTTYIFEKQEEKHEQRSQAKGSKDFHLKKSVLLLKVSSLIPVIFLFESTDKSFNHLLKETQALRSKEMTTGFDFLIEIMFWNPCVVNSLHPARVPAHSLKWLAAILVSFRYLCIFIYQSNNQLKINITIPVRRQGYQPMERNFDIILLGRAQEHLTTLENFKQGSHLASRVVVRA
ncbi:hypothetical protein VP01_362g6 [Puccinia sorghi]|uniref:Uncharacterized protein n=1 Tax=Puccinia sorghi TaxID=27349 RepID=A0A0L6UUU1_9BASI|nr:hypothetical protein VP01_362g6 [Puccinia sorghi]